MNKYVIAALVASTSGKNYGFDALLDAPEYCGLEGKDQKPTLEALRLFMKAGITEFVRGRYHAEENIVGEDCFGDWMVEEFDENKELLLNIIQDPLAHSLHDY